MGVCVCVYEWLLLMTSGWHLVTSISMSVSVGECWFMLEKSYMNIVNLLLAATFVTVVSVTLSWVSFSTVSNYCSAEGWVVRLPLYVFVFASARLTTCEVKFSSVKGWV